MEELKKHKKNIEFLLLFVPLVYLITQTWAGELRFDWVIEYHIGSNGLLPNGLGNDGHTLISIFGPYILWKVFAKFHLN